MKRRKLNGKFFAAVATFLIIFISIFKIPSYTRYKALKNLGYSEEAISAIIDKKLNKEFIENGWYSELLNEEVIKDDFDMQYLNFYLNRESFDNNDKELYQKLLGKYSAEELEYIFMNMTYEEIRPLIIFDVPKKIDTYIKDITKNGLQGLRGSYFEPYVNVEKISNPSDIEVFVNTRRDLGTYVPELVTLDSMHAIAGIEVREECAAAFEDKLCTAARQAGYRIYAVSGYVDYETQYNLFDYYDLDEEAIEREVYKAGFNERQTGLVLSVTDVDSANSNTSFKDSKACAWLKEHAHEYGFILRYPNEKASITLKTDAQCNTLRYVGVDLATKIYESGLSFDEYYYYYLAD